MEIMDRTSDVHLRENSLVRAASERRGRQKLFASLERQLLDKGKSAGVCMPPTAIGTEGFNGPPHLSLQCSGAVGLMAR